MDLSSWDLLKSWGYKTWPLVPPTKSLLTEFCPFSTLQASPKSINFNSPFIIRKFAGLISACIMPVIQSMSCNQFLGSSHTHARTHVHMHAWTHAHVRAYSNTHCTFIFFYQMHTGSICNNAKKAIRELFIGIWLEPICCKKWQKKSKPRNWFGQ